MHHRKVKIDHKSEKTYIKRIRMKLILLLEEEGLNESQIGQVFFKVHRSYINRFKKSNLELMKDIIKNPK